MQAYYMYDDLIIFLKLIRSGLKAMRSTGILYLIILNRLISNPFTHLSEIHPATTRPTVLVIPSIDSSLQKMMRVQKNSPKITQIC